MNFRDARCELFDVAERRFDVAGGKEMVAAGIFDRLASECMLPIHGPRSTGPARRLD